MVGPIVAAVGASLAAGLLVVGALLVHRRFRALFPREATGLGGRTYAAVRFGVVAGTVLGSLGGVVGVLDTVGTVASVGVAEGGVLVAFARAVPVWASELPLVGGAVLLLGAGVAAAAGSLRADAA